MVLIPYAKTYTTTVQGCAPKLVHCEKCGFEYVYLLEVTTSGEGTSMLFLDDQGARSRSLAEAEALLHQGLDQGCEVVPCPTCGTIQYHMLARARALRYNWMQIAGIIALAVTGILVLPATIYAIIEGTDTGISGVTMGLWALIGVTTIAGFGLLIQRVRLMGTYDPNDAPADIRIRQGQDLAVSKVEYLAMNDGSTSA